MAKIFGHLNSDHVHHCLEQLDSEWTALVNLPWARQPTQQARQRPVGAAISDSDVVLIIPQIGIIYLEVKEGLVTRRADGKWRQQNRRTGQWKTLLRDPLEQSRASQANCDDFLKTRLRIQITKQRPGPLSSYSGVWFPSLEGKVPDTPASENTPLACGDWLSLSSELMRLPRLKEMLSAQLVDLIVRTLMPEIVLPLRGPAKRNSSPSEQSTTTALRSVSSADLDHLSMRLTSDWLRKVDNLGVLATPQQSKVIGALLDDSGVPQKCIEVVGAAGTGKTLIAAKTAYLMSQRGHRVLLTCRRSSMKRWLQSTLNEATKLQEPNRESATHPVLVVETLEKYVLDAGETLKPGFLDRIFTNFNQSRATAIAEMESRIRDRIRERDKAQSDRRKTDVQALEGRIKALMLRRDELVQELRTKRPLPRFDYVIVDEAQGIDHEWQLLVRQMVAQDGTVVFLGDPTQRNAKAQGLVDSMAFGQIRTFFLDKNCRNTRNIFEMAVSQVPTIGTTTEALGPPGVRVRAVRLVNTQLLSQIGDEVERFVKEGGGRNRDVFVIIPHKFHVGVNKIRAELQRRKITTTTSVMERDRVFVGDPFEVMGFERSCSVVVLDHAQSASHSYVACSRSRLELTVICDRPSLSKISHLVDRGTCEIAPVATSGDTTNDS